LLAKLHNDYEEYKSGSSENNTEDEEEWQDLNIFGIINTMNIKSEFEHLYIIIKISLTFSTSRYTDGRNFSKIKIIKSRPRFNMD
jgi:hypothetical protein